MRRILLAVAVLILAAPGTAWADALYRMQVDGLACPFCAYGVEQKLEALEGVEGTHIDINKGVVAVRVTDATRFTPERMEALFNEAGFTFRGMERQDTVPAEWPPSQ